MDKSNIDSLFQQRNRILNSIDFQNSLIDEARSERSNLKQKLEEINEEIKEVQQQEEDEDEERVELLESDNITVLCKEYRTLNRIIDSHRKEKRTAQIPNIFAQRRKIHERIAKVETKDGFKKGER